MLHIEKLSEILPASPHKDSGPAVCACVWSGEYNRVTFRAAEPGKQQHGVRCVCESMCGSAAVHDLTIWGLL